MYQVPALIKHPVWLPLAIPLRYPDPEKVPPVGLVPPPVVVFVVIVVFAVVVGAGLPDLGRYLIPEDAQLPDWPTGAMGTKVPV